MSLEEYRRQIDALDRQIVALLNQRAELARRIGMLKGENRDAVYDAERERQVYANICAANSGPLPEGALKSIYAEIISASRALERPLKVAYLGPPATFTHEAAQRHFGTAVDFLACRSIAQVFAAAERGEAHYGVVPVENSLEGIVSHTLDLFVDSDLKICAEVALEINQHLMGRVKLEEVRRVYSHPQALAQARGWLAEHLPEAELTEAPSTVRGAELAAQDPAGAAVGPALAAQLYGLSILVPCIQDSSSNVTRFLVIGPEMSRRSGQDKTALMFSIKDRVGALHDALGIFKRHSINLTRIESRPSKRKAWDYIFFVDLEGHPEEQNVGQALQELAQECVYVKVLGAWPRE